jgi:hypothetical protein
MEKSATKPSREVFLVHGEVQMVKGRTERKKRREKTGFAIRGEKVRELGDLDLAIRVKIWVFL